MRILERVDRDHYLLTIPRPAEVLAPYIDIVRQAEVVGLYDGKGPSLLEGADGLSSRPFEYLEDLCLPPPAVSRSSRRGDADQVAVNRRFHVRRGDKEILTGALHLHESEAFWVDGKATHGPVAWLAVPVSASFDSRDQCFLDEILHDIEELPVLAVMRVTKLLGDLLYAKALLSVVSEK